MNNLKTITCPRCKGFGYIRGQKLDNGRQLNNYKRIEHGLCFACKGAKVLHMNEDGKIIREENGRILEYDKNGRYLGILKNKSTKIIFEPVENTDIVFELKESEKIREREISIKRMIIKVCMETVEPKDALIPITELAMERTKQYCEILSKDDNTKELTEFLENTIPVLEDTNRILYKFKQHEKPNVKEFINKYREYNSNQIGLFKNSVNIFC